MQEDEIVKAFRILLGVDDLGVDNIAPQHLRIMPRMPYGWTEVAVDKYPTLFSHDGKVETALLNYRLVRSSGQMSLNISANKAVGPVSVRLGPFKDSPAPYQRPHQRQAPRRSLRLPQRRLVLGELHHHPRSAVHRHPLIDPGGHVIRALPDLTKPILRRTPLLSKPCQSVRTVSPTLSLIL